MNKQAKYISLQIRGTKATQEYIGSMLGTVATKQKATTRKEKPITPTAYPIHLHPIQVKKIH